MSTGNPVSSMINLSMSRSNAPPPVSTIPRSATSLPRSGGVCSSACLTALTMPCRGSSSACSISFEFNVNARGTPSERFLPLTVISRTCALARHLERRILATPQLELLAPVELNIVCFRHRGADPDALNARIVADLHEAGVAAPSTTTIGGRLAIRAAIVNHRTQERDVDALVDAVVALGATSAASQAA